ncbi:MAG: transglycosylase domain-containing protein [Saprospiraceae bacterium]|nr:transglycosylase domain-containing protein [Saprospiraceae bacterium]
MNLGTEHFHDETSPKLKRLIRWLWVGVFAVCISFFSFFIFLSFNDIPGFEELENPRYDLASVIYDVNGVPFGKYYIENRIPVDYNELSPHLKNALLSTEDDRFFQHSGIDFKALIRVAFKTIILRQPHSGGGSTISQQLAKLLFKRPDLRNVNGFLKGFKMMEVKFKEWLIAVKLERSYTKEEIMAMYLNKFEFVNGAHGIQAASQIYFDKNQEQLSVAEAATLIGMLKNPSLYNPARFPEKCLERRNVVLNQMKIHNFLTAQEYKENNVQALDMSAFRQHSQSEGPAPYFRAELTKWLKELFQSKGLKKSDGTDFNIYTDGLKIFTTLDMNYQKYAEEAVWEHMKINQERYWKVWKNRDPWTFEADDAMKVIRKDILDSQIKGSERYLSLRQKMLGDVLSTILRKYPLLPLSDNHISALISVEEGELSWSVLVSSGRIDKDKNTLYQSLIATDEWPQLKEAYQKLQIEWEKMLFAPVPMKVFDYSDDGFKEVAWSPYDSVRYHRQHIQAGMLVSDPVSGHVKAWVGGTDHRYFKFDHVTMRRAVGSTIKPFVYTQAMAVQGISPCQTFDDIQYTISPEDPGFHVDKEWSPSNADNKFTGNKYNLFHGLLYSKNSITVKLLKEMGTVKPLKDLLHNLGIDRNLKLLNGKPAVPDFPSICLGAVDLTLLEMTGAYTPFGNNGVFVRPTFVSRIEDKNGRVVWQAIPERKSAINALHNAVMLEMLKNNVGGQFSLRVKTPVGGKTGTTNDYADAWFMGVTPSMVIGVWTGGEDKWIRFLTLDDGQGFVMARPIVEKFLQKLEKNPDSGYDPNIKFGPQPPGLDDLINCGKYKQVSVSDEQYQILKKKLKQEEFDDEF